MKRLLLTLLIFISGTVQANNQFGGYVDLLEKINIDSSYSNTKESGIKSLATIPDTYVFEFSQYAYKRYLKSNSESDYTGLLEIIPPEMLSSVVEAVMLSVSYSYDFLDHEFYLANTPGIEFKNASAVYEKVSEGVKNACELEVWNAVFVAKHAQQSYRFETSCKAIKDVTAGKNEFTEKELLDIYNKFRDIDGY